MVAAAMLIGGGATALAAEEQLSADPAKIAEAQYDAVSEATKQAALAVVDDAFFQIPEGIEPGDFVRRELLLVKLKSDDQRLAAQATAVLQSVLSDYDEVISVSYEDTDPPEALQRIFETRKAVVDAETWRDAVDRDVAALMGGFVTVFDVDPTSGEARVQVDISVRSADPSRIGELMAYELADTTMNFEVPVPPEPTPIWEQPWFLPAIVIAVIFLAVVLINIQRALKPKAVKPDPRMQRKG